MLEESKSGLAERTGEPAETAGQRFCTARLGFLHLPHTNTPSPSETTGMLCFVYMHRGDIERW